MCEKVRVWEGENLGGGGVVEREEGRRENDLLLLRVWGWFSGVGSSDMVLASFLSLLLLHHS